MSPYYFLFRKFFSLPPPLPVCVPEVKIAGLNHRAFQSVVNQIFLRRTARRAHPRSRFQQKAAYRYCPALCGRRIRRLPRITAFLILKEFNALEFYFQGRLMLSFRWKLGFTLLRDPAIYNFTDGGLAHLSDPNESVHHLPSLNSTARFGAVLFVASYDKRNTLGIYFSPQVRGVEP